MTEGFQDELSLDATDLEGLLEAPKQHLGLRRILTCLRHPHNECSLFGHAPLAIGYVPIGLGEEFTVFPGVWHG
ncbi:hypothetical protein [Microvirga massiliensis]|uniref:hypothetical protein n=1 Tax=Microvirga massiliensis TaxID=1033741 RepID=UPI0012B6AB6A|nr:hypothetical protein [Microvirga massiliensis]